MNTSNSQSVVLSSLILINSTQNINQSNPRLTSGNHPLYKHSRSYTFSLESYEYAAYREYIILMRNFNETQQFPDYHVIITVKNKMSVKAFLDLKAKVFAKLDRWKLSGYYVLCCV